ncbi:MAG: hypothetical protein GX909_02325 [Clostridiaceae bacterium]|nr:hypothetical protein [Clostridiaceae bacterium]
MDLFIILLRQIFIMFIFALAGYFFLKKGIITPEGNQSLANILIWVSIPSIILKSFMISFSTEKFFEFGLSFLLSAGSILIAAITSALLCRRLGPVDEFSSVYNNAGFIGIPLVQAVLGEGALFYLSSYIAVMNIIQWSYGSYIMGGRKKFPSIRKLFTNPIIFSVILGLILFILPIDIPNIFKDVVSIGANMSTPLSMLMIGAYLAQSQISEVIKSKTLYFTSFVSLIIIPLIIILIFVFIPEKYTSITMTILIATAAPSGTTAPILAEMYGENHGRAVQIISQTTIFSMFNIPLMITIASRFLG